MADAGKHGTEEEHLIGNKTTNESLEDSQDGERGWRLCHSTKGVCLALLAGAFSAFNNTLTVFLERIDMPAYQILLFMYSGSLLIITPIVIIVHGVRALLADTIKQRILLVSIGVTYTIADTFQVLALGLLPIGNVTALYRGAMPIVTPLLAWIFLRKPYTKVQIVNTVLCLLGIIFTAQPSIIFGESDDTPVSESDITNQILGYTFSILCGCGFSITYVMGAAIGDDVSVFVINFYENFIGTIINLVLVLTLTVGSQLWELHTSTVGFVVGLVVTFICNFCCRFRSLQIEPPTTVVLLVNIQIVIAYLADYIFFKEIPNTYDIIGAALIIFSSGFVAIATSIRNVNESAI
ncbi:solute carrier family 35 member G2-like [Glandiceps talaboti]